VQFITYAVKSEKRKIFVPQIAWKEFLKPSLWMGKHD
jgi:hypothetical protein